MDKHGALSKSIKKQGIKEGDCVTVALKGFGSVGAGTKFVRLEQEALVLKGMRLGVDPFSVFKGIEDLIEYRIIDLSKIESIAKCG